MQDDRRIRERAHAIWEQEGRPEGREQQHWSQAEQEVGSEGEPPATLPGDTSGSLSQAGLNPGDEAAPGTPGTGDGICPECQGTGRVAKGACGNCGGTGIIVQGIAGG